MLTAFFIGDIAGMAVIVAASAVLLVELSRFDLFFSKPFLRRSSFHWSAAAVATTGIAAAVLMVGLSIGATIVLIPGVVTLDAGRGLEPVVGLLFGIPGVVAGLIANPLADILSGKLSLGSIAGTITTAFASYLYWRVFAANPGLNDFTRPRVWLRYAATAFFVALVIKGVGIAGWLATLNVLPPHVAWFVAFPATFATQFVSHMVVGPILTRALHPFVDRLGLAVPGTGTPAGSASRPLCDGDADGNVIAVRALGFQYRHGTAPALDEVTLLVPRAQVVGVVGANGSGKTTLCLALNGLVPRATQGTMTGSVVTGGLDTRHAALHELAVEIGMVLQNPEAQFFTESVEDEVAFGPENLCLPEADIEARVRSSLGAVGMEAERARAPLELSGGQKQRVAIAAALATAPPILVMDEPTSELDPQAKSEVMAIIADLRARHGMTVVVTSHETDELVRVADRIVVLSDEGRIVADGDPVQVLGGDVEARGLRQPQLFSLWRALPDLPGPPPRSVPEAARRLRGAFRPLPPPAATAPRGEIVLECRNLSYVYPNGTAALAGIDLEIRRGEFVALMGRNGCGKSTLSRHFIGLLRPSAGTVAVCGRDSAGMEVADLARLVGYVFQNPDHQLFAPTVAEEFAFGLGHLGVPPAEMDGRREEALALVGLDVAPGDVPHFLGRGDRQKLAIATILAMRPQILVIDEPTTGQDWRSASGLLRALKALNQGGLTILVVTHDSRLVAEWSDRVLVVSDGRIIGDGTPRELLYQIDILERAAIRPPPVVELVQAIQAGRAAPGILTVEEFARCFEPERVAVP